MTSALTYHPPHLIDTAPLAVRYAFMTQAILSFITAGHMSLVLRYSEKLLRVLRVHNRLTGANVLVRRKRDMLFNSAWRRRVLWSLGGREKLRRWDEFNARFMPRLETKSAASLNGYGPVNEPPAWLNTPERIAESERLKAHARNIMRGNVNPNITRDRCKTDFDGLFRLPPLPRKERLPANIKIYTQNTMSEYDWNPIPFAKERGFGPAIVWPREFYAAMIADGEMAAEEVPLHNSIIPRRSFLQGKNRWMGNQISQDEPWTVDTRSAPIVCEPNHRLVQDDKEDDKEGDRLGKGEGRLPIISLRLALPPKTYRALFEDPV